MKLTVRANIRKIPISFKEGLYLIGGLHYTHDNIYCFLRQRHENITSVTSP